MIFIVGEAFVNLSSGKLWKAVCPQRINRFAILKQADHVVYRNPGVLDGSVPAPQLAELGHGGPIDWSDSWSDDDLREATASLKQFEQYENEGF